MSVIFVAAPPGEPWHVTLDQVEGWLRERWPDVFILRKHINRFDRDYLSFDATVESESRHGNFFDRHQLTLEDGSPEVWADSISWFLSRLPAGSRAVGALEHVPEPSPMPANPTPEQVITFFHNLDTSND